MMSPYYVLSAVVVLLSMPWASSANCLCSISGDPHITTCDTKTNFAWQGAGAYSVFKTSDAELQCDFDYPRYDNGTIIHQMFTYVSSCRISYKTVNGCEFTMLTGGNNDQQTVYVGNSKMTLSDVKPFLQKYLPSMGVNVDIDVENAKTTCTMQTQQGPIAFEIAPYQVHVTSSSTSQCNGMCGTCDGNSPLNLNLSDASSINSYSTSFAADGSNLIQPIQLKPLPIGCISNATLATPSPTNGSLALGQTQNATSSQLTSMPTSSPLTSAPLTSVPGTSSTPTMTSATPLPSSAPGLTTTPSSAAPGTVPASTTQPQSMAASTTPSSLPTSTMPSNIPMAGMTPAPSNMPMPGMSTIPSNVPTSTMTTAPGTMPVQTNGTQPLPSYPTPSAIQVTQPNPQMINDNPVFESPEVLRKVIDQCMCGQPKSRYYSDAVFGRYFENCVYDKSFPGAEVLALSNMKTLFRIISKGFKHNNASMAPMDMNMCKKMILEPVVSKRPDQIPLDQGVSYIPTYTKQRSTGVINLRPTVLTGTGEQADECEIDDLKRSRKIPSPVPTSMWTRVQPPAPTMVYMPTIMINSSLTANNSMAVNSVNTSSDMNNTNSSSNMNSTNISSDMNNTNSSSDTNSTSNSTQVVNVTSSA